MKRKLWKVNSSTSQVEELAKKYNISSILAQVLFNRNVKEQDFDSFLNSSPLNLYPADLLPDIKKAVQRIKRAVKEKERILIFGDYDVDGITSLAIFYEFIKDFPDIFSFYIPHRIKDGYGLNRQVLKEAKEKDTSLIIAFDCGTNAKEELDFARSNKIDVIIADHHQPKDGLNDAFAFINPKREDSGYPFSDLSSAAISFKLLQLLKDDPCFSTLDLVALSLVCDVAPLKGENRTLLHEGLKVLRKSNRPAIRALCEIGGIKQKNIDTFHIGYILGPRINAAGRVAHADDSLRMFLSDNPAQTKDFASKLQEHNQLRRSIEGEILKEAVQQADFAGDDCAIIVHGQGWHPGVLGIVASRLVDKYYRPTFVISFEDNVGRGSGRSIHSLHLMKTLDGCSDYLYAYGGHKKAAGIEILRNELDGFKKRLNESVRAALRPQDFIPVVDIDLELNFKDINLALVDEMDKLKPFGEDNAPAQFISLNVLKKGSLKRLNNAYSLWLKQGETTLEGIIYNKEILDIIEYAQSLDLVYSLDKNSYHNIPRLVIRDCRLTRVNQ